MCLTSVVACVLISLSKWALASRTPLIVFQHEVINYASDDLFHQMISQSVSLPDFHYHHYKTSGHLRTLYQVGDSEKDLPECEAWAVCNKIDVYDSPWLERQCRCPKQQKCPSLLTSNDGHTIMDRTRQFKLCEPIKKLPKCRYFRDITWTLSTSGADNITTQVLHCHCPKGSVAYLIKMEPYQQLEGKQMGYLYSFACSPQSRLRCQRKEPCRLFTVRKRLEMLDEVNTNTLCQCPHGHHCPKHHTHPGVLKGKSYIEENIRTYSGYCIG